MDAVLVGMAVTGGIVVAFLVWAWLQLRRIDRTVGERPPEGASGSDGA